MDEAELRPSSTANLFKISVPLIAASCLLWLAAPAYAWLAAFAVTLGLGYGLRFAPMPAVLIEQFRVQHPGAILGIFFMASGVAAVLGPPLPGPVLDVTGGHAWGIGFALAIGVLGFLAVAPLRLACEELACKGSASSGLRRSD